mmetsp:Transcript_107324/g.320970  ORF Transcript_107324/g.320970 Transcript_107324/m.320970 type:complete len:164 (-) Transcript_107324:96-587(-)
MAEEARDRFAAGQAPLQGAPMPFDNPMQISMEDRAFLESFGRRIAISMGVAAVAGGTAFYGLARLQGWRRRGLWTTLGATAWPCGAWYFVVMQEQERVGELAKRLQFTGPPPGAEGDVARPGRPSDDEALARLFPPPPSAAVAAAAAAGPPRGLMGGMRPPGQ